MNKNTHLTNELHDFLKDDTPSGIDWVRDINVTHSGSAQSYHLSGFDGHITDPTIIEDREARQKYIFENLTPLNQDEAVAETMMVEPL